MRKARAPFLAPDEEEETAASTETAPGQQPAVPEQQQTEAAAPPDPGAGIVTRRVYITPEIAEELLESKGKQRRLKKNAIATYADDMMHGRWLDTGEPVIIDSENHMRDGQNRMAALIESGIPGIWMNVTYGVAPDSTRGMNIGVPRRLGDIITLETEVTGTAKVAAVTSRMYRWDVLGERISSLSGTFSYLAQAEYFREHEHEITSACAFEDSRRVRAILVPSVFGSARIILRRVDFGAAEDFLTQLVEGGSAPDSPITLIRHRLAEDRRAGRAAAARQGRESRDWPASEIMRVIIFWGWNHWRDGKHPGKVALPHDLRMRYPMPR